MRYTSFTIKNYRAITGPLTIDLNKKSLLPIIGINESGKTTILQAIFAFDSFNDTLNDGLHLSNTSNLYLTSSPPPLIEAQIELNDDTETDELFAELSDENKDNEILKSILAKLKRKGRSFQSI